MGLLFFGHEMIEQFSISTVLLNKVVVITVIDDLKELEETWMPSYFLKSFGKISKAVVIDLFLVDGDLLASDFVDSLLDSSS